MIRSTTPRDSVNREMPEVALQGSSRSASTASDYPLVVIAPMPFAKPVSALGMPPQMQAVCVEFAVGAQPLPGFTHPEHALDIFGPEDGSISQDIIDKADHAVYVPTVGCMNPAVSDKDLTRTSRDVNIRLKLHRP